MSGSPLPQSGEPIKLSMLGRKGCWCVFAMLYTRRGTLIIERFLVGLN